jgi:predicted nucleic acid-binding protein
LRLSAMNQRCVLDSSVATLAALQNPSVLAKMAQAQEIHVLRSSTGKCSSAPTGILESIRAQSISIWLKTLSGRRVTSFWRELLIQRASMGLFRAELDAKGQIIQPNDMWIAALTRQYGLILLTRDRDFVRVSCLSFEVV